MPTLLAGTAPGPLRRLAIIVLLAGALAAVLAVSDAVVGREARSIGGTVIAEDGRAIAGAVVRVQATPLAVHADDVGRFEIAVPEGPVALTAWAPGYFVGGGQEHYDGSEVTIRLTAIAEGDNEAYDWLSVDAPEVGCANCHSSVGTDIGFSLPVDQWRLDAHGTAASNERFLTMYSGSNVLGDTSPPTRYITHPDYGLLPLPPDPNSPYYGPGYLLDFPGSAGNCGSCHLPQASVNDPYGINPLEVSGVAAEGVGCDFCHKVSDVLVGEDGVPLPNRPGVVSVELSRPPEGHQFFAGPFDDVALGEDTYSSLYVESRFCASCHFGVFWDTVVYDSYGEWLRSDFSDPNTGRTCQSCHMPPTGDSLFALPEAGAVERDPATIASHLMAGAADAELLRSALTLEVDAERRGSAIELEVAVRNVGAGHHVPTDSPLRHVILVVEAAGPDGDLEQLSGPTIPEWGGIGEPGAGYYGGSAGTAYAKVLEELWTELSPTGAYWNPTRVVSDNRIPAGATDTTTYSFAAPKGEAEVTVRLIFRRAFIELAEQKGWDRDDIEIGRVAVRP